MIFLASVFAFALGWFLKELLTAPTVPDEAPDRFVFGEPDQAALDEFYRAAERRARFDAESG